jgi:predicted NBD/HSP70 family sugar kinase
MNASGLRINNERAVLTAVATQPGRSGADVARLTGLGPQSVMRILAELHDKGLLLRGEVIRGRRGQPATPIYLNPDGAFMIGCEIGWRHFHILLRNFTGDILAERREDYDFPDSASVLQETGRLAQEFADLLSPDLRPRLLGMGLAMPGGIGRNIELFGAAPDEAAAWQALDIQATAEAASGLRVFPFNDGNAACWAELAAYPPPRPANLAYFQVGTAVGAGLIAEGRLWEGPTRNSANLGSMLIADRTGRPEFVHLIASILALERRLTAAGLRPSGPNPGEWDWPALEPVAGPWLEDAAHAIATAILNTHAVMEFDTAVVDGIMPRPVVERLVKTVRHYLEQLPALTAAKPSVEMGRRGASAAARGAALKPIYRHFYSPERSDMTGH